MVSYSIKETGHRFHRFVVLGKIRQEYISPKGRRFSLVRVICDCGNILTKRLSSIKSSQTKSCGCLKRESTVKRNKDNATHRMTKSRFYIIWIGIKSRVLNPNQTFFDRYGGRGIKICDRWRDSFENFRDDMLPTYKDGLQIDRIDNDGDYEPSNCRWVTPMENSRNSSITRSHYGKCVTEWADDLGVTREGIYDRIRRKGESLEEAINHFRRKKTMRYLAVVFIFSLSSCSLLNNVKDALDLTFEAGKFEGRQEVLNALRENKKKLEPLKNLTVGDLLDLSKEATVMAPLSITLLQLLTERHNLKKELEHHDAKSGTQ